MALSDEVRLLKKRWDGNSGWPKRLEWLEIENLRGWAGQRVEFRFPIVAITGENGVGKSTVLQCAASVYQPESTDHRPNFAYMFLPDTPWDKITNARISYSVREGNNPSTQHSIRKPTDRWRGNPERRRRHVRYIDLTRIIPVSGRIGYQKLANPNVLEASSTQFDPNKLRRLSTVMGRQYQGARMSYTNADDARDISVMSHHGNEFSGFHQGAGEMTVAELFRNDFPNTSLVLIDEIETSLHPRTQRRLIRDLAELCRKSDIQVILTTHSPYILEELPDEGRIYIMNNSLAGREVIYEVSPELAMTHMDDKMHPECVIWVEDRRGMAMLVEIINKKNPALTKSCSIVPCGPSNVGKAFGQVIIEGKAPGKWGVFLDGDVGGAPGCYSLPGGDAPERVVFKALEKNGWPDVAERNGRRKSDLIDACERAISGDDHHEWVGRIAEELNITGSQLWQSMCSIWSDKCLTEDEHDYVVNGIIGTISGIPPPGAAPVAPALLVPPHPLPPPSVAAANPPEATPQPPPAAKKRRARKPDDSSGGSLFGKPSV